jgi:peroxiredoxin Q/BCP
MQISGRVFLRSTAVSIVFAVVLTAALLAAGAPSVGSPAPDFNLHSQEGTPVSLKDLRGKWVVLYFYPKDFTRGCTLEARKFQTDLPKYHEKNAVILGVSVDSVESHEEFCAKEGLEFKLLSDASGAVSNNYGSLREMQGAKVAARNTFLIDPKGVISKVFLGVDPDTHSQQVLAALSELQKS